MREVASLFLIFEAMPEAKVERVPIQEASLRLNVSQRTIRESIRLGELKAFREAGPQGERWVVELPEDGWLDRHKKSYLDLAKQLPKWWWANEAMSGTVHYIEELGIEEIEPVYLCGLKSENIWSAKGHLEEDRCPECIQVATERSLPLDPQK